MEFDLLLGLDYFKLTKLGVFPSEGLLTYPDGHIYVNEEEARENSLLMMTADMMVNEDEGVAPEEYIEWECKTSEITTVIPLPEKNQKQFEEIAKLI